ncbi:MAG: hypothetical protein SGJ09_17205 [Phycisphaerae bacterium]|nr:hypothetical protein [Phycisphaerae bacterium]
MPQETKQDFRANHELTQGTIVRDADPTALRLALDQACDYRGDVTITLKNGSIVEGYLFDRKSGPTLEASVVRLIPAASPSLSGEEKVTVRYSDIAQLTFSGKDTAAGKTWENWLRRYAEKKLKGEAADIE